jgi:hypothetical protein
MATPKVQLIKDLGCGLGAFLTAHDSPNPDQGGAPAETPAQPPVQEPGGSDQSKIVTSDK